jgi:hypothetical protein
MALSLLFGQYGNEDPRKGGVDVKVHLGKMIIADGQKLEAEDGQGFNVR